MCNELGRLSINCVTMGESHFVFRFSTWTDMVSLKFSPVLTFRLLTGDFFTPSRISKIVKDLQAGFSLLNLKNDSLRRRFDALKVSRNKKSQLNANGKESKTWIHSQHFKLSSFDSIRFSLPHSISGPIHTLTQYDVKKTEEVVYDLSLRRLIPENVSDGGLGSQAMSKSVAL